MKIGAILAVILLLAVAVVPASAIIKSCSGIGSCVMNQTPNLTAGSPGTPGTPGAPAYIDVNYTFTGSSGTNALVTNIGTASNALLDFTIPRGEKGDKGDPGTMPDVTQFLFINGTRSMTGKLNLGGYNISNVGAPAAGSDAATKTYADSIPIINASYLTTWNDGWNLSYPLLAGGRSFTGKQNMGGYNISNTGDPTVASDVSTRGWSITQINSSPAALVDLTWNTSTALLSGARVYTGKMNHGNFNISNVSDPVAAQDSATRGWSLSQINSSPVASVDLSWNTSYDTIANQSVVNASIRSYVAAANTSMKSYVDARTDMGWNISYDTIANQSAANASMKNYVDGKTDSSWNITYPLLSGTRVYTGKINHGGFNDSNISDPVTSLDAANRQWSLSQINSSPVVGTDLTWNLTYPLLSGLRLVTGKWNFAGFNISNVSDPVAAQDAATRGWALSQINSSPVSGTDLTWNLTYPLLSGLRVYTGKINHGGFNDSNISDPVTLLDAANRQWTLSQINSSPVAGVDLTWNLTYPLLSGLRLFTGKQNFAGFNLSNISDPVAAQDASTRGWAISQINSSPATGTDLTWNLSYLLRDGSRIMLGKFNAGGFNVSNVSDPVAAQDAATRTWALSQINSSPVSGTDQTWNLTYPLLSGARVITGKWNHGGFNISNTSDPVALLDVVNRQWALSQINSSPSSGSTDQTWNLTYPLLSGARVFTGKQNLGGFNISNITTVAGSDAVTLTLATAFNTSMKAYVDNGVGSPWNNTYPLLLGTRPMQGKFDAGKFNVSNVTSLLGGDAVNKTYAGTHGAAASISDASTVNHLLGVTPTGCEVQPTVANTSMSVTAMSSTTFTVSSWRINATNGAGAAGAKGIAQTIYWECWV